jgi:hypothetical protein
MIRIRRTATSALFAVLFLTAGFGLAACGGDTTGPDPQQAAMQKVAGHYVASQSYGALSFTTTASGETIDWLAVGGSLEIDLAADGTTTGRVFVPGGDEDGSDWEADLKGTWTLAGSTIRFSHKADTFVRDMPFTVRDGRLDGDQTFGGTRVRVVLARR